MHALDIHPPDLTTQAARRCGHSHTASVSRRSRGSAFSGAPARVGGNGSDTSRGMPERFGTLGGSTPGTSTHKVAPNRRHNLLFSEFRFLHRPAFLQGSRLAGFSHSGRPTSRDEPRPTRRSTNTDQYWEPMKPLSVAKVKHLFEVGKLRARSVEADHA
jgi:hypothetical protein